jgi:prepilin-type N-terminal cleavage/methylation domain-containing protein
MNDRARRGAFTLIEMLTVIVIIGVLAAILIPTPRIVVQRARKGTAKAEITQLEVAILSYVQDFGAPPPDHDMDAANKGGPPFANMNTPNECLVWYLTRDYVKDFNRTTEFATEADAQAGDAVYAGATAKASLDIPSKRRRDFDEDGFWEFTDPWGFPYLYRAYYNTPKDPDTSIVPTDPLCPGVPAGHPGYGKTLEQGVALYNEGKGFDLYSVGSNGVTRYAYEPAANGYEQPFGPAEHTYVWGQEADGNDIGADEGGNVMDNDRARDDVCNWQ